MARGKEESSIIINHIFPEKYDGLDLDVECSNQRIEILKDFEMNVGEMDKKYELLTMIENENKMPASKMIKSHKYYKWKEYFLVSPYLKIFGIKAPVIRLPLVKSIMEKIITILILADRYIVGNEDASITSYIALEKLIEIYYKKKHGEKNDIQLTSLEKKSLSEDILGFNVWNDEMNLFDCLTIESLRKKEGSIAKRIENIVVEQEKKSSFDNGLKTDKGDEVCLSDFSLSKLLKEEIENINKQIKNIISEFEETYSSTVKTCESKIEFISKKENVLRIPVYLKPVIEVIYSSYKEIPWMYAGKELPANIYNKFDYNYYDFGGVTKQEWETLNIMKIIRNVEQLDAFEKDGFLDNYYQFVYKTLCKILDDNNKYLVFYAIEKIYTLELFELEMKIINEHKVNQLLLSDKKKRLLGSVLKRIFKLNGAWSRLKLAECVLAVFFENIKSLEDDLADKLDEVFADYEEDYVLLRNGERFSKRDLNNEIRECIVEQCEWYDKYHRKALESENNFSKWCPEYVLLEETRSLMVFVIQASVSDLLQFKLRIAGENGIWGKEEPVNFMPEE